MKQQIRKILSVIIILSLTVISMSGCGPMHMLTDEDGPWRVCFIADTSGINDHGYNQYSYEASRDFCAEHDIPFTYKLISDDNVYSQKGLIDSAVAQGYNVMIVNGVAYAPAVQQTSKTYEDIKFIFLDGTMESLLEAAVGDKYYENPEAYDPEDYYYDGNLLMMTFKEEVSGFLAGYTAVGLGYHSLGFLGGMDVSSVSRYGYGFIQGINEAAKDRGITDDIHVKFGYAGQFFGSPEITAAMKTWYKKGTEVVFACGGGISASVAEAAADSKQKVIGVDVDQSSVLDAYGRGITITSAMKGLKPAIDFALQGIVDGRWEKELAGKSMKLGLVSSEEPEKNFVGIPLDTTQWNENFTLDDYRKLLDDVINGKYNIIADDMPKVDYDLFILNGSIM